MTNTTRRINRLCITLATVALLGYFFILGSPDCLAAELPTEDTAYTNPALMSEPSNNEVVAPEGTVIPASHASFAKALAGRNGWDVSKDINSELLLTNLNGNSLSVSAEDVSLTHGEQVVALDTSGGSVFLDADALSLLYNCPGLRFWQLDNMATENGFALDKNLKDTELRKYTKIDGEATYVALVERSSVSRSVSYREGLFPGTSATMDCQVFGNVIWMASFADLFSTEPVKKAQLIAAN